VVRLCLLFAVLLVGVYGYQVGSGIYDITGPAAETGMMGYAMTNQTSTGIHFRLRARAYIFAEDGNTTQRIVFVSTDSCMIYTNTRLEVVRRLQAKFGSLYTLDNVMMSGIHTHSGPGGYSEYAIFDITTLGFYRENFETIVNGIYNAILRAHDSLVPNCKILVNNGTLLDSNINRSPSAYANNPAAEKAQFEYNVDKEMTLLRIENARGEDIGMLNWFAVHGTSMNNWNTLISGDNKGRASYLFEQWKNGRNVLPGKGKYVAIFGQSNEGDVSPNTKGAFCNNGHPCEVAHSTCGGTSEGCRAYGPGKDDFQSADIIGTNQFKKAQELYTNAKQVVSGKIEYIHQWVDMTNIEVRPEFSISNKTVYTCKSALGDSFAGGTTDGPGDFNFVQGTNKSSTNAYWNFIARFLADPPADQVACHYPKPILLYTGGIDFPTAWEPTILSLQVFKIGQFFLVGVPGEFSTMSGRRLRKTIKDTIIRNGGNAQSIVVIAGLSNAYSHYITTLEEYAVQRYEGASTIYGPHSLEAYQQLYSQLTESLIKQRRVSPGPLPQSLTPLPLFLPPVIEDSPPVLGHFGEVHRDAQDTYNRGDKVIVSFWGANPRNNFMTEKTFLTVEFNNKTRNGDNWVVVADDGNWETKYKWQEVWVFESLVTVEWDVPVDQVTGSYRIRTFGYSRDLLQNLTPYTGTSRTFSIN